jgi:hypothetical protein
MVDTPSISRRMIPPIAAFLKATLAPPLMARTPPVMKPAATAFQGSSFYLYQMRRQSILENTPPHIAKDPPKKGALFRTCISPPIKRYRRGAFHTPI